MAKKNADLKFRLKKLMKQENLSDEIKHNNLMTEKHKKVRRASNYFEHSLFSFLLLLVGFPFLLPILHYQSLLERKNMQTQYIVC